MASANITVRLDEVSWNRYQLGLVRAHKQLLLLFLKHLVTRYFRETHGG